MEIVQLDVNLLARLDVGDGLREDVGPLLREQRRHVALAFGRRVNRLRLLAFADDAADVPVADGHDELVDGGIVRQREDILAASILAESKGIVKLLRDLHGGDVTEHAGLNIGVCLSAAMELPYRRSFR